MPARAYISTAFTNFLNFLRASAYSMGVSAGSVGRVWQVPAGNGSQQDIAGMHFPAFDRSEINTMYEESVQNAADAGPSGDVVAAKMQLSYVAAGERAYRSRHASPVRCIAHASGRRIGHGNTNGVFTGVLARATSDWLVAGGNQG